MFNTSVLFIIFHARKETPGDGIVEIVIQESFPTSYMRELRLRIFPWRLLSLRRSICRRARRVTTALIRLSLGSNQSSTIWGISASNPALLTPDRVLVLVQTSILVQEFLVTMPARFQVSCNEGKMAAEVDFRLLLAWTCPDKDDALTALFQTSIHRSCPRGLFHKYH